MFEPHEPRAFNLTVMAYQAGNIIVDGDATWDHDKDFKGNPVKEDIPEVAIAAIAHSPVSLHTTQTQAVVGEDVVVTLAADNSLAAPPMTVKMTLQIPSGWSAKGTQGAVNCSGQCSLVTNIHTGVLREIQTILTPNEPGKVAIQGKLEWFFDGDVSTRAEKSTELAVVVNPAPTPTPSPIPTPPPPGDDAINAARADSGTAAYSGQYRHAGAGVPVAANIRAGPRHRRANIRAARRFSRRRQWLQYRPGWKSL